MIRELRAYGLVTGRYDNDYRLEEPACLRDISLVIDGYLERALQYKFRARNLSQEQREAAVEDLLWFLEGIEGADPGALGLDELLVKYSSIREEPTGETFLLLGFCSSN